MCYSCKCKDIKYTNFIEAKRQSIPTTEYLSVQLDCSFVDLTVHLNDIYYGSKTTVVVTALCKPIHSYKSPTSLVANLDQKLIQRSTKAPLLHD